MRIAALLLAGTLSLSAFAAEISGKWSLTTKDGDGNEIKADLIVMNDGGKLSGTIGTSEGTTPLKDVEFKENVFSCKLMYGDTPVTMKLTLDGDTLKGNWFTDDGHSGAVEAARQAAAPPAKTDSPVAGVWKIDTPGQDGNPIHAQLTLKQEGGAWSGQIVIAEYNLTLPLADVKVQGAAVSFNVSTDNGSYAVEAHVSADQFEGNSTAPDGTKKKFSGTRQ